MTMTPDPKTDPARRCMRVAEWPEKDRACWAAAIRGGDLLEEAGPASHWRQGTRCKVESSYGRFLTFLERNGHLDRGAGPDERLSPHILEAFVVELKSQVASVTVAQRLTDLAEAFRVMVPEADTSFLRKAALRCKARARPSRDKGGKIVHPRDLLDLGLAIMDGAQGSADAALKRACRFRNGLIIALLATRAIRRTNLAGMRLGVHLLHDSGGWRLAFSAGETKNHTPLERTVPAVLVAYLERYLAEYRPVLLRGNEHDGLWISYFGGTMAEGSIYDTVREITEAAFGVAINLHAFRDCQATWMAIEDPRHVHAIPSLLGHSDHRTGERFYNQAGSLEAGRVYQQGIADLRATLVPRRRRSRRKGRERPCAR